ncbi:MAG: site-2 protease family protein [Bacillota bacterium]|nr:site-2 protease family protein [Bacillota bacterium]
MLGLDPIVIALRIPALLIAITFHEFAHARMAYHFGDRTAARQGRMNLNPINHLDPVGTIMILLVGFGWAKPVPINPYNFNHYRKGLRWVSFAGPMVNFTLGFISMLILHILINAGLTGGLFLQFIVVLMQLNILLGIFNLIPIPPLDGSKILMSVLPDSYLNYYYQLERYAPLILIGLILFRVLWLIIEPAYNLVFNIFSAIIRLIPGI